MKAQAESQVFIYILTIIIVGLILLFGIKYIGKIMAQGEQVDFVQFQSDTENIFNRERTCFKCIDTIDFAVPKKIKKLCFVDVTATEYEKSNSKVCDSSNSSTYSFYICDAWTTRGFNVNLITDPLPDKPFNIGPIDLGNKATLCFDIKKNNVMTLRLTGKGDKTFVEEYVEE